MAKLLMTNPSPFRHSLLEGFTESLKEAASALADAVDTVAEKAKKLFTSEKKVVTSTTQTQTAATPAITIDPVREQLHPLLLVLGSQTEETFSFARKLYENCGVSAADLTESIRTIIGMGLSFGELKQLQLDDIKALIAVWKLGRVADASPDMIYSSLPQIVLSRSEVWMGNMTASVATLVKPRAIPRPGGATLEDILRDYVGYAAEGVEIKFELAFKLFRIVINISGGAMPPINTLKMAALWGLMLREMETVSPMEGSAIKRGGAMLAMFISLSSHIATEGVASVWGSTVELLSDTSSDKAKDTFYKFYGYIGDEMSAKKYLAWNKTAGVLIENEDLEMTGAMRMMSTFTVGRSFIRGLTTTFKIGEFFRDLSPIPGRRTLHDVLTLFRLPSDYERRTQEQLSKMDALVQGHIKDEDISRAAVCYYELLKLKLAYIPYLDYGKGGGIVDPDGAFLDVPLIDSISLHAFSRINKGIANALRRKKFKRKLVDYILQNQDKRYLEYFGEPRRPGRNATQDITYE